VKKLVFLFAVLAGMGLVSQGASAQLVRVPLPIGVKCVGPDGRYQAPPPGKVCIYQPPAQVMPVGPNIWMYCFTGFYKEKCIYK
jgi:hypothetical protein